MRQCRRHSFTRFVAVALSTALLSQVVLAQQAELNLWETRRTPTRRSPTHHRPLLACLPDLAAPAAPLAGLSPLPTRLAPLSADPRLATVADAASAAGAAVTVEDVHLPSGRPGRAPVVVFIQDVHGHAEAQANIAAALTGLHARFPTAIIGIEAAAGDIDAAPFRGPRAAANRFAADVLLKAGVIAGPEYAALSGAAPLALFGVEEKSLYLANVAAVRSAWPRRAALSARAADVRARIDGDARAAFSPALRAFADRIDEREKGTLPLADYLLALSREPGYRAVDFPELTRFLAAFLLEKKIDAPAVEAERARLVRRLAEKLSSTDLQTLTAAGLALKAGRSTPADFHAMLRASARRAGVSLTDFPHLATYLDYVALADRLNAERVLAETAAAEERTWAALTRSEEEKRVAFEWRDVRMLRKLVSLTLSPADWGRAHERRSSLRSMAGADLSAFENFYAVAERRNGAIAERLLNRAGSSSAPITVLVAGGFHTDGLRRELLAAGASVAVMSPRLTDAGDADGAAYLSVFTRERTPLSQIFDSPRLTLANTPAIAPIDPSVRGKAELQLAPELRAVRDLLDARAAGASANFDSDPAAKAAMAGARVQFNGGFVRVDFAAPRPHTISVHAAGKKEPHRPPVLTVRVGDDEVEVSYQRVQGRSLGGSWLPQRWYAVDLAWAAELAVAVLVASLLPGGTPMIVRALVAAAVFYGPHLLIRGLIYGERTVWRDRYVVVFTLVTFLTAGYVFTLGLGDASSWIVLAAVALTHFGANLHADRNRTFALSADERRRLVADAQGIADFLGDRSLTMPGQERRPVTDPLIASPDLIMVFGVGNEVLGERAADLYLEARKLRPDVHVVFAGGVGRATPPAWVAEKRSEAQALSDAFLRRVAARSPEALEAARAAVILEDKSTNSGENVAFTLARLSARGIKPTSILVIHNPLFQLRSALATWLRQSGLNIPTVGFAPYRIDLATLSDAQLYAGVRFMLGEIDRLRNYPAQGFTVPVNLAPVAAAETALLPILRTIERRHTGMKLPDANELIGQTPGFGRTEAKETWSIESFMELVARRLPASAQDRWDVPNHNFSQLTGKPVLSDHLQLLLDGLNHPWQLGLIPPTYRAILADPANRNFFEVFILLHDWSKRRMFPTVSKDRFGLTIGVSYPGHEAASARQIEDDPTLAPLLDSLGADRALFLEVVRLHGSPGVLFGDEVVRHFLDRLRTSVDAKKFFPLLIAASYLDANAASDPNAIPGFVRNVDARAVGVDAWQMNDRLAGMAPNAVAVEGQPFVKDPAGMERMSRMFVDPPGGKPLAIETDIVDTIIGDFPPAFSDALEAIVKEWVGIVGEENHYEVGKNTYHVNLSVAQDIARRPDEGVGILKPHDTRLSAQNVRDVFDEIRTVVRSLWKFNLKPKGVRIGADGGLIFVFEHAPAISAFRDRAVHGARRRVPGYVEGRPKPLIHITLYRMRRQFTPTREQADRINAFFATYAEVGATMPEFAVDRFRFGHETRWMNEGFDLELPLMIGEDNATAASQLDAYLERVDWDNPDPSAGTGGERTAFRGMVSLLYFLRENLRAIHPLRFHRLIEDHHLALWLEAAPYGTLVLRAAVQVFINENRDDIAAMLMSGTPDDKVDEIVAIVNHFRPAFVMMDTLLVAFEKTFELVQEITRPRLDLSHVAGRSAVASPRPGVYWGMAAGELPAALERRAVELFSATAGELSPSGTEVRRMLEQIDPSDEHPLVFARQPSSHISMGTKPIHFPVRLKGNLIVEEGQLVDFGDRITTFPQNEADIDGGYGHELGHILQDRENPSMTDRGRELHQVWASLAAHSSFVRVAGESFLQAIFDGQVVDWQLRHGYPVTAAHYIHAAGGRMREGDGSDNWLPYLKFRYALDLVRGALALEASGTPQAPAAVAALEAAYAPLLPEPTRREVKRMVKESISPVLASEHWADPNTFLALFVALADQTLESRDGRMSVFRIKTKYRWVSEGYERIVAPLWESPVATVLAFAIPWAITLGGFALLGYVPELNSYYGVFAFSTFMGLGHVSGGALADTFRVLHEQRLDRRVGDAPVRGHDTAALWTVVALLVTVSIHNAGFAVITLPVLMAIITVVYAVVHTLHHLHHNNTRPAEERLSVIGTDGGDAADEASLREKAAQRGSFYETNDAAHGAFWREHVDNSRRMIAEGIARVGRRDAATVLGVSAARDIPLAELARAFDVVNIVDIDEPSLRAAIDTVPADAVDDHGKNLRAKLNPVVRDVTGGASAALIARAREIIRAQPNVTRARDDVFALLDGFDPVPDLSALAGLEASYVISSGLSSQLSSAAEDVLLSDLNISEFHDMRFGPIARRARNRFAARHADVLASLLRPDGRVYWSDTIRQNNLRALTAAQLNQALLDLRHFMTTTPWADGLGAALRDAIAADGPIELLERIPGLLDGGALTETQALEMMRFLMDRVRAANPNAGLVAIEGGLEPLFAPAFTADGPMRAWLWFLHPNTAAVWNVEAHLLKKKEAATGDRARAEAFLNAVVDTTPVDTTLVSVGMDFSRTAKLVRDHESLAGAVARTRARGIRDRVALKSTDGLAAVLGRFGADGRTALAVLRSVARDQGPLFTAASLARWALGWLQGRFADRRYQRAVSMADGTPEAARNADPSTLVAFDVGAFAADGEHAVAQEHIFNRARALKSDHPGDALIYLASPEDNRAATEARITANLVAAARRGGIEIAMRAYLARSRFVAFDAAAFDPAAVFEASVAALMNYSDAAAVREAMRSLRLSLMTDSAARVSADNPMAGVEIFLLEAGLRAVPMLRTIENEINAVRIVATNA